jgi:hypothetical protein
MRGMVAIGRFFFTQLQLRQASALMGHRLHQLVHNQVLYLVTW